MDGENSHLMGEYVEILSPPHWMQNKCIEAPICLASNELKKRFPFTLGVRTSPRWDGKMHIIGLASPDTKHEGLETRVYHSHVDKYTDFTCQVEGKMSWDHSNRQKSWLE